MSDPAARLAGLGVEEKRALAARLLARRRGAPRRAPASLDQERLWFLDVLTPGAAAYTNYGVLRLRGELDRRALARSLRAIVRRHEALRTSFEARDGRPMQVIRPTVRFPLPLVDLSGLPEARRGGELRSRTAAFCHRPFDLERGPTLLRAALFATGTEAATLATAIHHVVSDEWSLRVLFRELAALYGAFRRGEPSPLPDLPIQYADYCRWQRERLQGERLEADLAFWREELGDLPPALALPLDRPRRSQAAGRGAAVSRAFAPEVAAAVSALAREAGATPFMTVLAAFQALLHRYTGQADVVVGTPVANRDRSELQGLIGLLVNTLVLRGRFHGEPSFRSLLAATRAGALAAYARQELPFGRLVEELRPERDGARNPLFQVMLTLQAGEPGAAVPALPGLACEPAGVELRHAPFDLSLTVRALDQGMVAALEYDADLFHRATARRLLGHFETLLAAAAAAPDLAVASLPLLSPPERQQVVREWSGTAGRRPGAEAVPLRIEARVRRHPDRVALVEDGTAWSYGELEERSRVLGARLARAGVGPESLVGIFLPRGADAFLAVLAVLRAGGAYLPLDPAYPEERLTAMLEDSGARLVVSNRELAPRLARHERVRVLDVAASAPGAAGLPAAPHAPERLAYVLYTSGSTGRPKGAQISHPSFAAYAAAIVARFPSAGEERVLQFASLSFDVSVEELVLAWLTGGTLVVAPDDRQDPAAVADLVERERVSLAEVPTAFWQEWTRELALRGSGAPPSLRRLLIGGEREAPGSVAAWEALGGAGLSNVYGLTETTITSTVHRVVGADAAADSRLPIGRPLDGAEALVLDRALAPVPAGVAGELCLGGPFVGRGYRGRPAATAERFVPHPFAASAGERLYRTGDLARHLPDGALDFLGRRDAQVKVRGFRVEPGEVAAVLLRDRRVADAVVVARGSGAEAYLAAYVVPAPGGAPEAALVADLREAARAALPPHMVPSAVVVIDSLPVGPTGKVDVRALPAARGGSAAEAPGASPRNPLEELVAGVWAEVLGIPRPGTDRDFFDLGGHSLLLTRVVSRLRSALGVEVPLRVAFERPTVAALAAWLEDRRGAGAGFVRPPLEARTGAGEAPLSFSQEHLWVLDRLEPTGAAYNVPTTLRLGGPLEPARLAASFAVVIRRHEVLRTRLASVDGAPVQRVAPRAAVPMPVVELARLPDAARRRELRRLVRREVGRPFDLARGPLLRLLLLRHAGADHTLQVTLHHAVCDEGSMAILVREVAAAYAALGGGRRPDLPELPVQYGDYARWQRDWLRGEVLDRLLSQARERLAGLPVLELPADRPRPPVQTFRGGARAVALPASAGEAVRRLARERAATPFMALLAAFQALLGRLAGQSAFAVGSPIANREPREVEGLVGFFVNMLVLPADLSGDPTAGDLVERTREAVLDAFGRRDLPFEKLVQELQPERDLSRNPLFQVSFQLVEAAEEVPALDGLEVRPEPGAGGTVAKFDLSLAVSEGGGRLGAFLEFNRELFDATTAARLLRGYGALVAAMAERPDLPVSELPLLAAAERHQLLAEWNDTAAPAAARPAHRLAAARAAAAPDAVAVNDGGATWSYGHLAATAQGLAGRLRRASGAAAGQVPPVAVAVGHGPRLAAAQWGVLAAGAPFVLMDPELPPERLAAMVDDSGAAALVVDGDAPPAWAPAGVTVVPVVPGGGEPAPGRERDRAGADVASDDLAYVCYTSGSTGRPKGVEVRHGGLSQLLRWHHSAFGLEPGDAVPHLSGLGFDATVLDLWPALAAGARVETADPETRRSPPALGRWLAERRVTAAFFTTPLAESLLAEGALAEAPLRRVLTGGDRLRRRPAAGAGAELVNLYGPTESTVLATAGVVPAASPGGADRPPGIGRPIAGTRVHLLDPRGRLAPLGGVGELAIGGTGLARGYRRRPARTAEAFGPDPFAGLPGLRLYRTGDLVRRRADGSLDFIGRRDGQVKLRGFRIEPGEVEAHLRRLPGVADAAVAVVREPARELLVACWVAEPGAPPAGDLREPLRRLLPGYMVPSRFVAVDALPWTGNGKVDRRRVAEIAAAAVTGDAAGGAEPPSTPVEELLAGLWTELLGVSRVGRSDGFFELGGHSLAATRLVGRLRAELGVELPLAAVFEESSLGDLARRLEGALAAGAPLRRPPLEPGRGSGPAPLSFAQQRLWFLDQLTPGDASYNVPLGLRLLGDLALPALARALAGVVARHEALRTRFPTVEGVPVQEVEPPPRRRLPVVDLARLAPGPRDAAAAGVLADDARRPFDLERGPLFRARLLRLAPRDHLLVLGMHHAVTDAASMEVLVRETAALYGAASSGAAEALPRLPVRYVDYARWQREWLSGETLEALVDHWRRRLGGAPRRLPLPTDRPRPTLLAFRGGERERRLADGVAGGVRALARRAGATPFMVVLAAFASLLHRITGEDDVMVGSPVANRPDPALEGVVGFFLNTLPFRIDLAGDPRFEELLRRVRATALDAYGHQDLPFEKLVEELEPEREPGTTPLFQVLLVIHERGAAAPAAGGLEMRPVEPRGLPAKFDLTLSLSLGDGGAVASLRYNADLFDGTTVERAGRRFERLLAGALERPSARLGELPLLAPAERRQLALEWNDTARGVPGAELLHDLFFAAAERTPERVAVVGTGEHVSYGELARRARSLAARLRAAGVGPECRVGIALRRSPAVSTAVLAVLAAGGACVPLDPGHPAERIAFVCRDAGLEALVTETALLGTLPEVAAPRVLVDRPEPLPTAPAPAPAGRPGAAGLVYVIYTSGSTGRPKGIAMSHGPLVNLVSWQCGHPDLGGPARRLQYASLGFDGSFRETFATWGTGGTLVLIDEALRGDVPALVDRIARERVEKVLFPAAVLHLVAEEARHRPGDVASLREVLSAGEQVRVTPAMSELFSRLGSCAFHNHYGPTETHMVVAGQLGPRPADWPVLPPIGRPIANVAVHVADRRLRLVPAGVPGELLVGGACPARGYLGRPGLTARTFVPDPFAGGVGGPGRGPGARLYRTGDLALRRTDGQVDFLGRIDAQVKIRGFRVEPGEVEAVLDRHPAVRRSVVVARPGPAGLRLVAYAVPEPGAPRPDPEELRAHLAGALPDAFVPSALVLLDELPLNANRKVDRAALPEPGREGAGAPFTAPASFAEEVVARVWADLLGVARVGVHDDFFRLGGHSLLATQAVARLRRAFCLESLPLRVLFERPTVAGVVAALAEAWGGGPVLERVARVVRRAEGAPAGERRPELVADLLAAEGLAPEPLAVIPRAGERFGEHPLSFAQQRLWFLHRLDPESPAYNTPAAVRMAGRLDLPAFHRALLEIVRRHDSLRTAFVERGGEPVQVVSPEARLGLPVVDLSGLARARADGGVRALAVATSLRPFRLDRGGLLRLVLVRLSPREHALLATFHHIVSDGWSKGVFLRELSALYRAFRAGRPSPLPELPIQYPDFARWQRGWLSGRLLEAQLEFWRERLRRPLPVLDLPTDRPVPEALGSAGATLRWVVPAAPTAGLRDLSARHGTTLYTTALAAFAALLHRYTWQDDLLIGCPVANRTRTETEDLVGFFVNTLVQRIDASGEPTFAELLRRVRETALDAQVHQDLPFERVVEEVAPGRDLGRNPLFQVLFQLGPASMLEADLDDLELSEVDFEEPTTKFHLSLSLVEGRTVIGGTVRYSTELFEEATVRRMMEHLTELIVAVARDPEIRLVDVPLAGGPAPRAAAAVEALRGEEFVF